MNATRNSWKNSPLSKSRERLRVDRTFPAHEFDALQSGSVPRDMDDKWFVFMEGDWLYIHRSWTGHCIFQVRLEGGRGDWTVAEVWVTRDRAVFQSQGEEEDCRVLQSLFDRLVESHG